MSAEPATIDELLTFARNTRASLPKLKRVHQLLGQEIAAREKNAADAEAEAARRADVVRARREAERNLP